MTLDHVTAASRIAMTALLLSVGATDAELDPALEVLEKTGVPDDLKDIARDARRALTKVRKKAT